MSRVRRTRKRLPTRSEDALVRRIEDGLPAERAYGAGVRLGIGDDAALWVTRAGCETVLTCDWFVEGTHFLREKHPADAVGWKCLARAVSDITAMGGVPRCFLLSLALPASHTGAWLDQFLGGLRRAARRFDCALAGGDTTRDERILINVTAAGEVRSGRAVLRSGARPGDLILVSGRLGEAELGLRLLSKGGIRKDDPLVRKHLYPQPPVTLGRWLGERRVATAMMDLSDGLSTDLRRLCAASAVGARIEAAKVPAVRVPERLDERRLDPGELALHGGDDYELLFTVSPRKARTLRPAALGRRITAIGRIMKDRNILLIRSDGREESLAVRGWDPFRTGR